VSEPWRTMGHVDSSAHTQDVHMKRKGGSALWVTGLVSKVNVYSILTPHICLCIPPTKMALSLDVRRIYTLSDSEQSLDTCSVLCCWYISTKISAKHGMYAILLVVSHSLTPFFTSTTMLGGAMLFLLFGLIYLYEASQVANFDPHDHIPRG